MISIGIGGILGRMGQSICAAAGGIPGVVVVGGVVRAPSRTSAGDVVITTDAAALAGAIDVFVDVSQPAAVPAHLDAMRAAGVPYLCGVTGLSNEHQQAFDAASATIPLLLAANFSVGVAVVTRLLELATTVLPTADIEIVETHHRRKRDAPSGTALTFATAIEAVRDSSETRVYGRQGESPRQQGEIGIHSLRGGGNPGEHRVMFAFDNEEIVIEHRALSRAAFADGALHAATWLLQQPPGRYTMQDVVGQ